MTDRSRIPVAVIQRLRMGVDGEGVRTLIGTAGCPLDCRYCLNPHCKTVDEQAVARYTPQALYDAVKIDGLYFQATGGGLTFGGGEPLVHMQAISHFADLCPESWSLWVETSLHIPAEQVALAAEIFDHFIVDVKSTDPLIYRRYTGGDVTLVLENLQLLLYLAGPERITVRIPVIPGYAEEASRRASEETIRALGVRYIDYLVYDTQPEEL